MSRCRCQSRRQLTRCCGPFLSGTPAPTPLALMRSRFAAYAMGNAGYIIDTTDPDGPQWNTDIDAWTQQITAFSTAHRFAALDIVDAPSPGDTEGFVHFRAHLVRDGATDVLDERSRFVKRAGRWLYHGRVKDD